MAPLASRIFGGLIGVALIVWVASRVDGAAVAHAVAEVDIAMILLVVPVVMANMVVRAWRWRLLLSGDRRPRLGSLFSALMVGYLANNVVPARGGDLVRVYLLGNSEGIAKSAVLATVLLERIIDLACACLLVGLAALIFPLPDWLRSGGLAVGAGAGAGLAILLALGTIGDAAAQRFLDRLTFIPEWVHARLKIVLSGFLNGIVGLRDPVAAGGFLCLTAVLWTSEIAIVWLIAQAFHFGLSPGEAWIVMLFAVFGTLIPALPAQIGAFEFAVSMGMESLGHGGGAVLAFALGWHIVLLALTSGIGAVCLLLSGQSLMPRSLAAEESRQDKAVEQGL